MSQLPSNEEARLEILSLYGFLDTPAEARFNDLILLASEICKTPVAGISLVDKERVWFKARLGLEASEIPRHHAFCAYTILQKDILVVGNAEEDPRFQTSRLVISHPYIKFYAGVPLINAEGHALGTLCVMDSVPRELTREQEALLHILARQVITLFDSTRSQQDSVFAHYDTVTNLPNQELFKDRLEQALALSLRNQQLMGVMLVSLDGIRAINDILGYVAADRLLREVSQVISSSVRDCDTLARFGNEEFAVLLTPLDLVDDAGKIAHEILQALSTPFRFANQELFVKTSIGIGVFPDDGKDEVTLLKSAGAALNRAREQGGNNYQFYESGRTTRALRQLLLENNLRQALERDEFVLYYQPQVSLNSFQLVGMEALIRWQHPGLGLLPPNEFIQLAEDSGLIVELGQWVLQSACKQSKSWQDAGFEPLRLAVNLSARQFQHPNLVEYVAQVLRETGLEPWRLELELIEGSIVKDLNQAAEKLRELRSMGVKISIDDFGTGYSSLSYLKRLPIDTLKIDRSFVSEINTDSDDAAIVEAIVTLGHALKLKVIAEGVEGSDQLEHLRRLNCDEVQGFLFSKPLSVEDFTELLAEQLSVKAGKKYDTTPLPAPEKLQVLDKSTKSAAISSPLA